MKMLSAIVLLRALTEHGGQIVVETDPGEATTIHVELPVRGTSGESESARKESVVCDAP